jgi:tetratricopeptide (TPR) repeat protein
VIRLAAPVLLALILTCPSDGATYLVAQFTNRTGDAKLDWIGESISEAIREAGESVGLDVATREDREDAVKRLSLRASSQLSLASVLKLAEQCRAQRAIYGQFDLLPGDPQKASKGSLRITARVFDLKKIAQVGENQALGALEDLPALEIDLSWQMLRLLGQAKVAPEELLKQHRKVKLGALENYTRGLMTPSKWLQHRYFTQAIRLDPAFPHPYFQLGRVQWWEERYREAATWLDKVPDDFPYHAEASFMLALSRYELSEYESARRVLEKVEPKLPVPEVWNNLAAMEIRLNRLEPALQRFRKSLEADPLDTDYQFNVGYALWKMRDFAAAADRFRALLDRSPDDQDAILLLGRCLASAGPRAGDLRGEGLERLKDSYTEPARPSESASLR